MAKLNNANLLENTISGKMSVEILAGKKNLEVRPISINKGQTLRKILSEGTKKFKPISFSVLVMIALMRTCLKL